MESPENDRRYVCVFIPDRGAVAGLPEDGRAAAVPFVVCQNENRKCRIR